MGKARDVLNIKKTPAGAGAERMANRVEQPQGTDS